jgi:hypothetical protein
MCGVFTIGGYVSLELISLRRRIFRVSYERYFEWNDMSGAGFGFNCLEDGQILWPLHEPANENLRKCLSGEYAVTDQGIRKFESSYIEPAVGRCQCGRDVVLDGDTRGEGIDCECGRIYNSVGQELAPRRQWEECQSEDY